MIGRDLRRVDLYDVLEDVGPDEGTCPMLLHLYWLALQLDWRVAIARVGVMSEDWQGCVTCRMEER